MTGSIRSRRCRAEFCQNQSSRCGRGDIDFASFKDGGRLQSYICLGQHIGPPMHNREYLVVSITVQNLVMIYAVVSII